MLLLSPEPLESFAFNKLSKIPYLDYKQQEMRTRQKRAKAYHVSRNMGL